MIVYELSVTFSLRLLTTMSGFSRGKHRDRDVNDVACKCNARKNVARKPDLTPNALARHASSEVDSMSPRQETTRHRQIILEQTLMTIHC